MPPNPAEIHCERCGTQALAANQANQVDYCIVCGLYVCSGCWRSRHDRCQACLEAASSGRSGDIYIRTARRADRRLREAAVEARAIAKDEGTPRNGNEAWADYACLAIKISAAEHGGARALKRLSGGQAARAWLLSDRLRRHAHVADAQLHETAAAIKRRETRGPTIAPPTESRKFHWRRVTVALGVGAVTAVVVILAPQWLGQSIGGPARVDEGILGGAQGGDDGSEAPAATAPGMGESPAPTVVGSTAAPAPIGFDFDAVRMGGGIGEGWVVAPQTAGAVAVAAFPTAVDRSAQLMVTAAQGTQACRSIASAPADVDRIGLEVLLDPQIPAAATIELRNPDGDPLLSLSLNEAQATLSSGSDPIAEAAGLEAGRWYGIEVSSGDAPGWRIGLLDGPAESGEEAALAELAIGSASELCLRADGPVGAAVSYNNVFIIHE